MVNILAEPTTVPDPDAWIFAPITCPACETRWKVTPDGEVSVWRWFFGVLGKTPGAWFVKTYTSEMGMSGTFLETKCPRCQCRVMRRERR